MEVATKEFKAAGAGPYNENIFAEYDSAVKEKSSANISKLAVRPVNVSKR